MDDGVIRRLDRRVSYNEKRRRKKRLQNRFTRFQVGPSNIYVTIRDGHVLGSRMILKADLFPSGVQRSLPLHLSGARNFRQVPSLPIYGVAQPTEYGIRTVLNIMKLGPMFNSHRVESALTLPQEAVWVNLREEPVVYLNNRPFVLRELDHPFRNMQDFRGLDAVDVQEVEGRLKVDILREASRGRGNVLLHEEVNNVLRTSWESLSDKTIKTSDEVYAELKKEGYQVDYYRVPITPEDVPERRDIDQLVNIFLCHVRVVKHHVTKSSHLHLPNIIFNCQRGTGRSILGIVTMYLTRRRVLRELTGKRDRVEVKKSGDTEREYSVILKLARMLKNGSEAKQRVDNAVLRCSDGVHSLRTGIKKAIHRAHNERDETNVVMMQAATNSLLRYFMLICFQGYLDACPFDVNKMSFAYSFESWMISRPELSRLGDLSRDVTSWEVDPEDKPLTGVDEVVFNRNGAVMSQRTILKSEYTRSRESALPEVPYFRVIDGVPVSAAGQSTMKGMMSVLNELGAGPQKQQFRHWRPSTVGNVLTNDSGRVIWINFREEPIIYIQGHPHVLRESYAPFRPMAEFKTGMSPHLLHNLELRLKDDVLRELQEHNGQILLHCEVEKRQLSHRWFGIDVTDAKNILTSSELFEELKSSGFRVDYHRIPLTVGKTPGFKSFDALFDLLNDIIASTNDMDRVSSSVQVVFNCYKGGRRSAMGMVVTCLLLKFHGFPVDDIVAELAVKDIPTHEDTGSRELDDADDTDDDSVVEEDDDGDASRIDIQMKDASDANSPSSPSQSLITDGMDSNQSEMTQMSRRRGEYKGILALIRILPNGAQVKDEVDDAIDLCGGTYNLRDTIAEEVYRTENQRMSAAQAELRLNRAVNYLESYAYLISFNSYLQEKRRFFSKVSQLPQEEKNAAVDISFSAWVNSRPELLVSLQNIRKDADEMLKVGSFSSLDEFASLYTNRNGNVLTAGAIIKNDYFVGCRSETLPQIVEGTINFRQVVGGLPIAGNGAPTSRGIANVVLRMADYLYNQGVHHDSAKKMKLEHDDSAKKYFRGLWLNMREEPVVYLNFHPYVLRDFDRPYVNVENTGITAKRVQAMERQLKTDVIAEIRANGGQLLLHDEDQDGNLIAFKRVFSEDAVLTPQEVYTVVFKSLASESPLSSAGLAASVVLPTEYAVDVQYCRMPITDEQAPSVESFDDIVRILENAYMVGRSDLGNFFITNCQMGRGRTTTTMIITYLWYVHRVQGGDMDLDNVQHKRAKAVHPGLFSDVEQSDMDVVHNVRQVSVEPQEVNFEQRLRRGEYKIIQSLVRLLEKGVVVKSQVDAVIDHCDHMQNLRTAIFNLVIKATTSVKSRRPRFVRTGTKYLARYFFLICYNAYFRDEASNAFQKPFKQWYEERPELQHVLEKYAKAFPPVKPPDALQQEPKLSNVSPLESP